MGALEQDREKIAQLARSSDAQKLRELLEQQSGQVRQAAQQAAAGDPSQLMEIMGQLMHSKEGAALMDRRPGQAGGIGVSEVPSKGPAFWAGPTDRDSRDRRSAV